MTSGRGEREGMTASSHPTQPSRHLDSADRLWLEQAAKEARRDWERARKRGSQAEKAQALASLSGILCDLEGPEVGLRLSRRAHHLWEELGDPQVIAVSGAVLAIRLLDAGQAQEALGQSATALACMRSLAVEHRHKGVCHNLGQEFLTHGFPAEAQAWLELALENPAYDDPRAEYLCLLSRALDLQGRLQEARDRLQEACVAYDDQWDHPAMARAMLGQARLELRLGHSWEASVLCRESLRFIQRLPSAALTIAQAHELLNLCMVMGGPRWSATTRRKLSQRRKWPEEH